MTAFTPAQISLARALTFEYECPETGALGKVHKFGHDWIEKREKFAVSGFEGVIGTVHSFASALFHSIWSLFTEKGPRDLSIQNWKDTGNNLVVIFKSVIGIVSPTVADWVDEHAFPLFERKKEEVQVEGQTLDEPTSPGVNEGTGTDQ